jgi:hypothetical protein
MRKSYIPHKTDRELRKYGYVPDADVRAIMYEIAVITPQLGWGEEGLADHSVRATCYPGELERVLRMAWNDPARDGYMMHARHFLEMARAALVRYKSRHGRLPPPYHPGPIRDHDTVFHAVREAVAANDARIAANHTRMAAVETADNDNESRAAQAAP